MDLVHDSRSAHYISETMSDCCKENQWARPACFEVLSDNTSLRWVISKSFDKPFACFDKKWKLSPIKKSSVQQQLSARKLRANQLSANCTFLSRSRRRLEVRGTVRSRRSGEAQKNKRKTVASAGVSGSTESETIWAELACGCCSGGRRYNGELYCWD